MKIIIVGDSIISLKNVRRVDKHESYSKKENHYIIITYYNNQKEHLLFDYADKQRFETVFYDIGIKLAEKED